MSGAQRFSSGLSGAGSGAAIGSMIAPGIGTAIGAGVGALGGFLFGGGPDIPELQFSPESLARLDELFPDLAAQIRANQLAYGDMTRAVSRQSEPLATERLGVAGQMSNLEAAQSMGGNAGNPMAVAQQADLYNRLNAGMYGASAEREMAARSALAQAGHGIASQYGQLGQMMNTAKGANIQAAMERDAARAGQQMAQYTANRQDLGGLMQGLGAIGGAGFQAYMDPYASNKLFGTELPQGYGQNVYYTGIPGRKQS